ncbi:MAG: transglutaminaseTgpA domain-containing protein [Nitriliruptoraceae bacterium]
MPRQGLLAALVGLVLLAATPAYERVLAGPTWRTPVLLAAAGGILVAALARWARLPVLLTAPLSAGLLLAALPTLVQLEVGWRAGLGPTWAALRDLADTGLVAIAEEVAPTEPVPGLLLLLLLGWWLVAYVAAELVLRAQRLGPALVVLATLWAVPLAVPSSAAPGWAQSVPWLVAVGALALAHVHAGAPGAAVLPVSGLLLLAGAVAAGVAAPGLLPGHGSEAWMRVGSAGSPRGYQPIVDVSTRLRAPEERDVLRVRATGPTYLRLAGLDTFDGATWRLGPAGAGTFRPDPARLFPADRPLPQEEPARRTRSVEAAIEVLALENIYVPLPYQPVEVLGPIRSEMVWSTEGGFLAAYDPGDLLREPAVGLTSGAAYRVLAEQPDPTLAELREVTVPAEVLAATTALPRPYPELGALAAQVYDDAGATTDIDRVLALQDWFVGPAGGFTYDLDVPALRGEDGLTRFVLEDRVGYCEYFATAMAVMLRETGIPARVAVGFLPGERVAEADAGERLDTFLVTTGDAHAWVEVLFPGYGWVTFEPTPRADGAQLLPRADELAPQTTEAERAATTAQPPEVQEVPPDTDAPPPALPEVPSPGEGATDTTAAAPGSGVTAARVATALVVLALLAVVLLWAPLQRRRRVVTLSHDPRLAVLAAQRQLYRTAARLGQPRAPQETTREVLRRWERTGRVPADTSAAATSIQAAAFGGELTPAQAATAVATLERASAQLAQDASTADVLRARSRAFRRTVREAWASLRRWWRGH